MRSAVRSLSFKNSLWILAALVYLASACHSGHSLTDSISSTELDLYLWNDFMPGKPPAFHATFTVRIRNSTDQDLLLHDADAMILSAKDDVPIHHFIPQIFIKDQQVTSLLLPKASLTECTFRTPATGLTPIDTAHTSHARCSIRLISVQNAPYLIRSSTTRINATQ